MSQRRRFAVRRSPVHGRGLFALTDLSAGEHLLNYGGAVVTWASAQQQWEQDDGDAAHTFFFDLGDGTVIDGGQRGNSARWINHGCEPNCEAVQRDDVIEIVTTRPVAGGEELLLDYRLTLAVDPSPEVAETYACRCCAGSCRATMLAPTSP
jgi:SET domain-containing protein